MAQLKIETKKVVVDGKKFRKVKSVQGYGVEELPSEYFKKSPFCFCEVDFIHIVNINGKAYNIEVGQVYHELHFQKMLAIVKEAGDRLHEINEKIKLLKSEWNGKEDFEI